MKSCSSRIARCCRRYLVFAEFTIPSALSPSPELVLSGNQLKHLTIYTCICTSIRKIITKLFRLLFTKAVPNPRDYLDKLNTTDLNLTTLNLSENGIDDKDATTLCNGIYKLNQLQELNLSGNTFTARGTWAHEMSWFHYFIYYILLSGDQESLSAEPRLPTFQLINLPVLHMIIYPKRSVLLCTTC